MACVRSLALSPALRAAQSASPFQCLFTASPSRQPPRVQPPSEQRRLIGGRPLGLLAMICYGGSLSRKLLLGVRPSDARQERQATSLA